MEKRQSSVVWLYYYLFPRQLDGFSDEEWSKIDIGFELARARFEKEIKEAYDAGVCTGRQRDAYQTSQEYYDEEFED